MKIAIMMRAMDQDSAFRAIVEGYVRSMVEYDHRNEYLLLYRTEKWLGRFRGYAHVREKLISAPHKFLWDQAAVPFVAWREGADVIFNPKFSVPLISPCPVTMGLQEPVWWAWPDHYEKLDVRYMRLFLPLYCRKAAYFFPNSQFDLDETRKYLGLPLENATVVYSAPHSYFEPIDDAATLTAFRAKNGLPERYLLDVTRVDHPGMDHSSSWHPGKNVDATVAAFAQIRDQIPHELVIAGRRVREYLQDRGWTDETLRNVHFTGFLPHEELPMLYSSADLFVIPSFYEGFGLTMVEAMACGCPVVASKTGACPEISGGAALLADPYDPADFAAKILDVLQSEGLRKEMRIKSLQRAADFRWELSGKLLVDGLNRLIGVPEQATLHEGLMYRQ